jgi:hypothetical protein
MTLHRTYQLVNDVTELVFASEGCKYQLYAVGSVYYFHSYNRTILVNVLRKIIVLLY